MALPRLAWNFINGRPISKPFLLQSDVVVPDKHGWSCISSKASPDPHPGTPVDPRDLLPKPKLTDGLQLKGKVAELRLELNSGGKKDKNHSAKKIALKKIVANMTMSNNDMVALFPDIITCMQIPSLEVKKMYAKSAQS